MAALANKIDMQVLTLVKDITHRTVIQDHHFTQIRLDRAQVLDVSSVSEGAMLAIVSANEELPLLLQPVDDWIRVLLYGCGEDDELVPFADFAQELVAVRSFVDVVEDWMLRAERGAAGAYGDVELYLDHVAGGHAAAFGERVDQGFVEVDDEGLLLEGATGVWVGVGGLS